MNEVIRIGENIEICGVSRIIPVLHKIQSGFNSERKTSIEEGKDQYIYRTIEDVVAEFKKRALAEDCTFFASSDLVEQGIVRSTVCLIDKEGNYVSAKASVYMDSEPELSRCQNCGSAISYSKKYAIFNLLSVADNKDDIDARNNKEKEDEKKKSSERKQKPKAEKSAVKIIEEAVNEAKDEAKRVSKEESQEPKPEKVLPEVKEEQPSEPSETEKSTMAEEPEVKVVKNSGTSISSSDQKAKVVETEAEGENEKPDEMSEEDCAKTKCAINNVFKDLTFEQILKMALGTNPRGEEATKMEQERALEFLKWLTTDFKGNEIQRICAQKMLDAYEVLAPEVQMAKEIA